MLERFKRGADDKKATVSAEERVRRKLAEQKRKSVTKSSKLLTIFCSSGPNPSKGWSILCYGGLAEMIKDPDIAGKQVLEIRGQVMKTSIWSPRTRKESLDISLPIAYFLVKHVCRHH